MNSNPDTTAKDVFNFCSNLVGGRHYQFLKSAKQSRIYIDALSDDKCANLILQQLAK